MKQEHICQRIVHRVVIVKNEIIVHDERIILMHQKISERMVVHEV